MERNGRADEENMESGFTGSVSSVPDLICVITQSQVVEIGLPNAIEGYSASILTNELARQLQVVPLCHLGNLP